MTLKNETRLKRMSAEAAPPPQMAGALTGAWLPDLQRDALEDRGRRAVGPVRLLDVDHERPIPRLKPRSVKHEGGSALRLQPEPWKTGAPSGTYLGSAATLDRPVTGTPSAPSGPGPVNSRKKTQLGFSFITAAPRTGSARR